MIERKSALAGVSAAVVVLAFSAFLFVRFLSVEEDETKRNDAAVVVELVADAVGEPSRSSLVPLVTHLPDSGVDSLPAPDENEVIKQKILVLVGTEESPIHTLYTDATRELDRECLPLLRDMLKDPAYKNRWRSMSNMLAWLSDSRDEASLNAILAYVRRPDLWNDAERSDGRGNVNVYGKAAAVGLLGFFDLDSATSTLRRAFTEDGAEELIGAWVNMPHAVDDYSALETIMDIRMQAASGLALSRVPENISLIEEQIEELAHWTWSSEYLQSEDVEDVMDSSLDGGVPYLALVDAMTRLDMIKDVGVEEFLRHNDTSNGFSLAVPYMNKYFGRTLTEGKTILDPCPICGKSRDATSEIDGPGI